MMFSPIDVQNIAIHTDIRDHHSVPYHTRFRWIRPQEVIPHRPYGPRKKYRKTDRFVMYFVPDLLSASETITHIISHRFASLQHVIIT